MHLYVSETFRILYVAFCGRDKNLLSFNLFIDFNCAGQTLGTRELLNRFQS